MEDAIAHSPDLYNIFVARNKPQDFSQVPATPSQSRLDDENASADAGELSESSLIYLSYYGFALETQPTPRSALDLRLQGFGLQAGAENRLADDFTVPGSETWTIDTLTIYSYETGATATSSLTDLRVQIWDGPPEAEGSRVVFGDRFSNRLLSSTFSNTYRVSALELEGTSRPILANVARIGATLAPGTYWLDWSAAGGSGSGPWAPPAAITAGARPGNGLQASAGEPFLPALDGAVQQEFPFRIAAHLAACDSPANLPWLSLGQTLGTTAGGATTLVDVTLDAIGLAPGTYSGVLCVQSNDPDTPLVEVPVSLVVAVLFLDGFESGSTVAWSAVVP